MYNLLMIGAEGFWNRQKVVFPLDRFLEYTDPEIAVQFEPVTVDVLFRLCELPTLLTYEVTTPGDARVVQLKSVELSKRDLVIKFDDAFEPIRVPGGLVFQNSDSLGIHDGLEQHRSHWAIKDIDLSGWLVEHDLLPPVVRPGADRPDHARRTVVAAARLLQYFSHSDLDDFVMEIGNANLQAGRDIGGRQSRAVAIGTFATRSPDATTADGKNVGDAIVRKAAQHLSRWQDDEPMQGAEANWKEFQRALEADHYQQMGGGVLRDTDLNRTLKRNSDVMRKAVTKAKAQSTTDSQVAPAADGNRVFIVHGRNPYMKEAVARFVREIGLTPVILHEQPNRGRTLFTKFQDVASNSSFAIALLHPDDDGGLRGEPSSPRARQNVVLELGFFIGKLGPERVIALVSGQLEKPSDFEGVVYLDFGENTDWRRLLARELNEAGMKVDLGKLLG